MLNFPINSNLENKQVFDLWLIFDDYDRNAFPLNRMRLNEHNRTLLLYDSFTRV